MVCYVGNNVGILVRYGGASLLSLYCIWMVTLCGFFFFECLHYFSKYHISFSISRKKMAINAGH